MTALVFYSWEPILLLTQSRVSYEVKPGSSGLYLVTSWKLPWIGDCTTSLGDMLHCCAVLKGKKVFLIAILNLSCSNWYLLSFTLPPRAAVQSPSPSSQGAAVRCPQSYFFSRFNKTRSLSLGSQGKCSSSDHLGGLLLNSPLFADIFSILGAPNNLVCQMGFNKHQVEVDNHFLWSTCSAAVNIQPRMLLAFVAVWVIWASSILQFLKPC